MKKLHIIIVCLAATLSAMAQTVGEAFYIYRNDGQFNAFFRDEVQSIEYSNYDADGNYYDEIVTQIVNTPDSIYYIPLAAIDSVGFVQPETEYKEGSVPLEGALFDYLISVDGTMLTFDATMPDSFIPHVGQKLVATDITEKLPNGFVGQVTQVLVGVDGIKVSCDNIELQEAVSQFYGIYEVISGYGGQSRIRGPRKAMHSNVIYNDELPFGRTQLPPIDVSAFITERNTFDINYNNTLDIAFTPNIRLKITRVVDDYRLRSHTNLLAVTDVDVETVYDIAGEASRDLWNFSFLPKQDFLIAGIPVYFDIGTNASLSGEIVAGFTIDSQIHQVTEVTYYDVSLLPLIGKIIAPIVNRVDGNINITTMDMRWDYLGFRAEFKPCVYFRVGLSAISHVAGWVGGEFEAGAKANGELMFDINRIRNAEPGTEVYDELKDLAKIDVKPYVGAHFMAEVFDGRYSFQLGKSYENPKWTWYQGRIIPGFSNTTAVRLSETKARVTANIINDCFIPYTVGFALYDEENNLVDTKIYSEKYWTHNNFSSYSCDFDGLDKSKKYKAYPVIRFFGKHDMLASPSADLDMHFPVEITDFTQTGSEYKEDGFTYNGKTYSYRYDCTVTVELKDATNVVDWGYVYVDPDGQKTTISLKSFSSPYPDSRYVYYRNANKSTVTLYPYVKLIGEGQADGEPTEYDVSHGELICPDSNHPHMIDLGLPSGTKWACCNVGANVPEQRGGRYQWGMIAPITGNDVEGIYPYTTLQGYVTIGPDIAGTTYDAATQNWGTPWRMPNEAQIRELISNCISTRTTQNGVDGHLFYGNNGSKIFLPVTGTMGGDRGIYRSTGVDYHLWMESGEDTGYYWSSTLEVSLRLRPNNVSVDNYSSSYFPFAIRPVCGN